MPLNKYTPSFPAKMISRRQVLLVIFLFIAGWAQISPAVAYQVPPVINDQTFSVLENSATSTVVDTVVATDATTYDIINGNSSGAFALDSSSGLLTVADGTQIDFELTPAFNLTVEVSNNSGTDTAVITVNVININDAPVMDDQIFNIGENSPNGTLIGTVVATDPDGNSLSYSILTGNTGGTFALNNTSGELTVADNTLLDFETQPVFNLIVMVSDGGLSDAAIVTVNLIDDNDPPLAVDDGYTMPENTSLNVIVPGVLDNDSDQDNDSLTSVLDTPPGNGTVTLALDGSFIYTPTLNFDGLDTFTYFANDNQTNSLLAATVTITVTGVNDAPASVDDAYTIPANTSLVESAPGILGNDTDPENDPLTAVLDTPPSNGTVTLALDGSFIYTPTLNFVGVDDFFYHAEDTEPLPSAGAWVTITVSNQPPTAVDDFYNTPEDTPLTVSAPGILDNDSDPENNIVTAVLDIGPSSGNLSFGGDGSFVFTPTLNFAGIVTFTYHAEDSEPLTSNTATVTINVTPENDPPTVDDGSFSLDENSPNSTPVGTINASDPDGDSLTFAITNGNTNNAFTISSPAGLISVNNSAALDFEITPVFTLTVQGTDNGNLSDEGTIVVNLNDLNEAPAVTPDPQTFVLPENSPVGTSVGSVTIADPDAGDTFTYAILNGNTGGAFALGSSGQLSVTNSAPLDFETTPVFTLTVQVTDSGNLVDTGTVMVNLTNVNEFSPDIAEQTFSVAENAANNTLVGTVVVTDSDGIDSFTFTIIGGDPSGVFAINNQGQIRVADNSTLDFETTPSYNVDVEVADSGNLTDTASMLINVIDANDAPIINDGDLGLNPGAIQETDTITLTGVFTDQDSADTHSITILWGDGNSDVLNLAAGVASFSASHTYQDDPISIFDDYGINVTVSDSTLSDSANTTATVSNVAPTLGLLTADPTSLDEGQGITLSGTFTEVSPLDSFTMMVNWGDGSNNTYFYPAGTTSFAENHTYQDNFQPATITVSLSDDDGGSDSGNTAVTINNLPPTANAGPDLIVMDGMPAALNGSVSDPGAWDTHTFEWDFGDGSPTSTMQSPAHIYPGIGVYTATLTVTDDDGASHADTAVVTVISPSDLLGFKTVSGNFDEGGTIFYTIVLYNTGTTAQLDNPGDEFVDVLPAELSLVDAQILSGGGTISVITATNTVTWSGAIAADASITLEIEATILPGSRGQVVSNQGEIFFDADGDGTNETSSLTDDPNQPGAFDTTDFTVQIVYYLFMPVVLKNSISAPDLVITDFNASSDQVEITVENQGNATTTSGFWVDFYINPFSPPTEANQLWPELADEGLVWGVTALLSPGESLTLIYSTDASAPNTYYVSSESFYTGSLPAGTTVYAQVDSAHENVATGGVLETHEITGDTYNNIVMTTAVDP